MKLTTQEYINFLQRYIILHSYIYYELNNNIISDRQYDAKAKELVRYKNKYPEMFLIVYENDIFAKNTPSIIERKSYRRI